MCDTDLRANVKQGSGAPDSGWRAVVDRIRTVHPRRLLHTPASRSKCASLAFAERHSAAAQRRSSQLVRARLLLLPNRLPRPCKRSIATATRSHVNAVVWPARIAVIARFPRCASELNVSWRFCSPYASGTHSARPSDLHARPSDRCRCHLLTSRRRRPRTGSDSKSSARSVTMPVRRAMPTQQLRRLESVGGPRALRPCTPSVRHVYRRAS
jgi:hypothetical protein